MCPCMHACAHTHNCSGERTEKKHKQEMCLPASDRNGGAGEGAKRRNPPAETLLGIRARPGIGWPQRKKGSEALKGRKPGGRKPRVAGRRLPPRGFRAPIYTQIKRP